LASRIVVRDVEAGYGAVRVLHRVSIEVREGETVALLGTNGNGKSTLIKCIMGMLVPDAGEIYLESDGARIDLTTRSTEEIVELGITLVPEGRRLFPRLTVEENLLLPLDLNNRADAKGIARARELLERVGLGGRGDSYPERLSGGEQQRVAIARALIHDPALILADEPTGNLDAETATGVLDLLDTLAREAGRTVLMATHSREVVGVADRIVAIQRGALVESPR